MVTIGNQLTIVFGKNVVVKVDGDTLGVADRYRASWGYGISKKPIFSTNIPIRNTTSFVGTLAVEGLYSTDNLLNAKATPVGGQLPIVTVLIEETDTQSPTPVKKTWTFKGQMTPFEKQGEADQFSRVSFTLDLTEEPSPA